MDAITPFGNVLSLWGDFISQKLTALNKLYVVEDDCLGKDNLLSVNRKCSVISSLIQL